MMKKYTCKKVARWILGILYILTMIVLYASVSACTTARYKDADRSAWAISVLQKRALVLDHASPTSGTLKVNYDSTGDTATLSTAVEAAVKGAVKGVKP